MVSYFWSLQDVEKHEHLYQLARYMMMMMIGVDDCYYFHYMCVGIDVGACICMCAHTATHLTNAFIF